MKLFSLLLALAICSAQEIVEVEGDQPGGGDDGAVEPREDCFANCGGIAGIMCDDGFTCTDIPGDDCDPENGGADCPSFCIPDNKTFMGNAEECKAMRFVCEPDEKYWGNDCGCGCKKLGPCDDFQNAVEETNFGACEMLLGYAKQNGVCRPISGCDAQGFTFPASLEECQNECCNSICAAIFDPVCGSDGETYSNPCSFEAAKCQGGTSQDGELLVKACPGECPCDNGGDDDFDCDNYACTDDWTPVCGSDGATYSNMCYLEFAAQCERQEDDERLVKACIGECPCEEDLCPEEVPAQGSECGEDLENLSCVYESKKCCADVPTLRREVILSSAHCENGEWDVQSRDEECGDCIPEDCDVWFDGCNTCSRSDNGFYACTLMACIDRELRPFCKDCPEGVPEPGQECRPDQIGNMCEYNEVDCCDEQMFSTVAQCVEDDMGPHYAVMEKMCKDCDGEDHERPPPFENPPECPEICPPGFSTRHNCADDNECRLSSCAGAECAEGEGCQEVQVECFSCPCPPQVTCVPVDECETMICTADYRPVCGTDGETYSNECHLKNAACRKHRLSKLHDGECVVREHPDDIDAPEDPVEDVEDYAGGDGDGDGDDAVDAVAVEGASKLLLVDEDDGVEVVEIVEVDAERGGDDGEMHHEIREIDLRPMHEASNRQCGEDMRCTYGGCDRGEEPIVCICEDGILSCHTDERICHHMAQGGENVDGSWGGGGDNPHEGDGDREGDRDDLANEAGEGDSEGDSEGEDDEDQDDDEEDQNDDEEDSGEGAESDEEDTCTRDEFDSECESEIGDCGCEATIDAIEECLTDNDLDNRGDIVRCIIKLETDADESEDEVPEIQRDVIKCAKDFAEEHCQGALGSSASAQSISAVLISCALLMLYIL